MKATFITLAVFLVLAASYLVVKASQTNTVTIKNIDDYLFDERALYIDIRERSEVQETGTIEGFMVYPLYSYFEAEGMITRHNGFDFSSRDVTDEEALKAFFANYETIYILCRSGRRTAYFKEALNSIGFDNVHDLGGFNDYRGNHTVYN